MPELGEFLNSIHKNKIDLMNNQDIDSEQAENDYKKLVYVINRCLSYFPDTILHAQEMNMRPNLDAKLQYLYYLHAIPKAPKGRFAKGIKIENPEHLEIVKAYHSYSNKKARKALELLSVEDIQYIKDRLFTGGIKKKKP